MRDRGTGKLLVEEGRGASRYLGLHQLDFLDGLLGTRVVGVDAVCPHLRSVRTHRDQDVEGRGPARLGAVGRGWIRRSEGHTSALQSRCNLVCRLLLEKKS